MDRKKLDKVWIAIEAARRSPQKAGDLADIAVKCGRRMHSGGKHPMWTTPFFPHRAFPIPHHGGNAEVSPRVRKVVLDHLEADAAAWEDLLLSSELGENGNNGGL